MTPTSKSNNHQVWTIKSIILVILFFSIPGVVKADGPIVCASGAGNVNLNNVDLSACGVPVNKPVYVELVAFSSNRAAQVRLGEGSQLCNVSISKNDPVYPCAVTVTDGVLDTLRVTGNPGNYRLTASPTEFYSLFYSAYTGDTTISISSGLSNVYTSTLSSGDVVLFERKYTYGEQSISSYLSFISVIVVLGLIVVTILLLRMRR